jgi:hypothetical protein
MYVHQVAEVAPAETTAPIQTADQPTDENTQHNEEEESNGSSDH